MTFAETMKKLESLGTAQNRKVYARHGAGDNQFGVSFANLYKLQKRVKTDQQLARQLWETGNADARSLAILIADPQQFTEKELDGWVKGIRYYLAADLFARFVVSKSRFAREKMEAWTRSQNDFVGQVGWDLLAILAMNSNELSDRDAEKCLEIIERDIHKSGNRTKHAMNGALIAIGLRNPGFQKLALAAAARIGKVEVDHGETSCKSPDAASYIRKAAARYQAKQR